MSPASWSGCSSGIGCPEPVMISSEAPGVVDCKAHGNGSAQRVAGQGGGFELEGVEQVQEVLTELLQRAVGVAEARLAVAAEVVEEHPVADGEGGDQLAPEAVVVGQAVDQDDRAAAADLEPGGRDVAGPGRGHRASTLTGDLGGTAYRVFRVPWSAAPPGGGPPRAVR